MNLQSARLYVITPDASGDRVVEIATAAVRGGADIIQLRHKTLARGDLLTLARRLRDLFPIHRAAAAEGGGWGRPLLIVNDHVDIALMSAADGVHLGPDDLSIAATRRIAGSRLILGASASTVDAARAAVKDGADYLGCGPAFATPIKSEKRVIGPSGIAAIAKELPDTPVFAIGGIDATNIEQLTSAGIHRACVIRAVAGAPDPEAAARRLRAMLGA